MLVYVRLVKRKLNLLISQICPVNNNWYVVFINYENRINITMNMTESMITNFKLSDTKKQFVLDKPSQRRKKLLANLDEQILAAQAALNGEEYIGKRIVTEVNKEGSRVTTTVPKRVNKWFFSNDGAEWLLEIRYGVKVLPLAKDKTAIVVGELENVVPVLEKVKKAVAARELDEAIESVLARNQ